MEEFEHSLKARTGEHENREYISDSLDSKALAEAGIISATSWDAKQPDILFSGIAYTEDAIIIGGSGAAAYRMRKNDNPFEQADGSFSYFIRHDGQYLAGADPLGQDIIYYYVSGANWAISNSLFRLSEILSKRGLKLDLHRPALVTFLVQRTLTEQLISHRTAIEQIRVLPVGHEIQIKPQTGDLHISKKFELCQSGSGQRSQYANLLERFVIRWKARIRALAGHFGDQIAADITGGRDSRIVLALLRASGLRLDRINFRSSRAHVADFQVAQSLAALLGFSLNGPSWPIEVSPDTGYDLWKYGNLGIYLPFYPPTSFTPLNRLAFHGGGGECFRMHDRQPAWKIAQKLGARLDPEFAAIARTEFRNGIAEMDVDLRDPTAMISHYRHFRSRFHFGRSWVQNLSGGYLISPLASYDLVEASQTLGMAEMARGQLACDLTLLLAPDLADIPFDKADKAFTREQREAAPFPPGHKVPDTVPELTIFSAPAAEHHDNQRQKANSLDLLQENLSACIEPALHTGLFTPQQVRLAADKLSSGGRLTKNARRAVHIITAGEFARIADG